jgi:peptidyl-tRNA hydrolase, PTH1 family
MFLFVGLGNIGKTYEGTPHNAGFYFVDQLHEYLGFDSLYSVDSWKLEKLAEADISNIRKDNEKRGILVKPQTFMNASGRTVAKLIKMFELKPDTDLVLIHDDLDLELGTYKIQKGIGPKGHNGVNSVMSSVGTTNFLRVRIGVETRQNNTEEYRLSGEDFVLKKYSEEELLTLSETISDAVKSLRSLIQF